MQPTVTREDIERREARADSQVGVRGIEGTLTNYQVRTTMDKRAKQFAACHEPSANRVPVLSGSIEFGIYVQPTGSVRQVDVRASDLGDRELERCFADVILQTEFPSPNGGEANIAWSMMLGPVRPGRGPEQWQTDRVERVVEKQEAELRETCDIPSAGSFTVTAYVSRGGRVIAAGVSARESASPELFDCIAEGLRSWRMPKPRSSVAKVSFSLAGGQS